MKRNNKRYQLIIITSQYRNLNYLFNDLHKEIAKEYSHIKDENNNNNISKSVKEQEEALNKLKLNYNPYTQMIKDMKKSERKTLKHMSIFTCILYRVYLYS